MNPALLLLFTLLLWPRQGHAHLIVKANPYPQELRRSSSHVVVIERDRIQEIGDTTLDGLLQNISGMQLVTQGPAGGQSSLFLRGHDARHTLVLIDGVIVNDPSNPSQQFDFGHLNTALIEKIEYLKGPQSLLYGPGALAGVIAITTTSKKQSQRIGGSVGSYEQFTGYAQHRGPSLEFGAQYQRTRGFSVAPAPSTPDGRELVEFRARTSLETKLLGELTLLLRQQQDRSDLDGYDSNNRLEDRPHDRLIQTERSFALQQRQSFHNFYHQRTSVSLYQNERETTQKGQSNHFRSQRWLGQWENEFQWRANQATQLGLDLRYEEAKLPQSVQAKTHAAYLIHRYDHEHYFASFGLRLNREDYEADFLSHQLSFGHLSETLDIKLSHSTGHQAPSLFQRFDPTYGNLTLRREKSRSEELSLEWRPLRHLTFQASFYQSTIQDRFDYDPISFKTINAGKARLRGIELASTIQLGKHEVQTSWDISSPKDLATGLVLARRSRQAVRTQLRSSWSEHFSTRLSHHYLSARRENSGQTLSSYQLWDLGASYRINTLLRAWIQMNNLFEKRYEIIPQVQTAGRHFVIGLEGEF